VRDGERLRLRRSLDHLVEEDVSGKDASADAPDEASNAGTSDRLW
jgi:hypothetical protein